MTMTSNDNQQYITVELFNSKMETFIAQIKLDNEQLRNELNSKIDSAQAGLRAEMQTGFASLHSEIQAVNANVQVNSAKIEMLQHTFYWGFAILAFIAAFVPLFRRERKESKEKEKPITRDSVLDIVNEAVAKAINNIGTVSK